MPLFLKPFRTKLFAKRLQYVYIKSETPTASPVMCLLSKYFQPTDRPLNIYVTYVTRLPSTGGVRVDLIDPQNAKNCLIQNGIQGSGVDVI